MQTDPSSPSEIPEEIINTGNEVSVAEVLGDELIKKLNSEKWDTREDALRKIKDTLDAERSIGSSDGDADSTDRLPFFNACCCVMRKAMNDKVAPVYFAACSLLDTLLETCAGDLNSDDIQAGIMPLMSTIIVRTGDTNQRVMERTCNVILELARKRKVGLDFVARYLTMQHKSMRKLRLVWGRLDLIRRSMLEFGFKRSTIFTAETVMPIVVPALDVPDEKVRKLAVRIVVDVYKQGGLAAVEKHIQNCKPALQNLLQQRFDEADGKLPVPVAAKGAANRLTPLNRPAAGMSSLPPLSMKGVAIKGTSEEGRRSIKEFSHPFGAVEMPGSLGGETLVLNTEGGEAVDAIDSLDAVVLPKSKVFQAEEEEMMAAILQDV